MVAFLKTLHTYSWALGFTLLLANCGPAKFSSSKNKLEQAGTATLANTPPAGTGGLAGSGSGQQIKNPGLLPGVATGSGSTGGTTSGSGSSGSSTSFGSLTPVYRYLKSYWLSHGYSSALQSIGTAATQMEGVAFSIFSQNGAGRVPVYSCFAPTLFHQSGFVSLDPTCERGATAGPNQGFMGYVASQQAPGLVLLVRCVHPWRGHLIVTNPGLQECFDNGYQMEGAIGWVPATSVNLNRATSVSVIRFYRASRDNHAFSLSNLSFTTGYTPEGRAFGLYAYNNSQRAPVYLCLAPAFNESFFVSLDAGCEGSQTIQLLGYISKVQQAGLTPIYRCVGAKGHLAVAGSSTECTRNGFAVEATLGYALP